MMFDENISPRFQQVLHSFFEIINHDKLKFGDMGFLWFCKFGQVEGVEGKPIIGVIFSYHKGLG